MSSNIIIHCVEDPTVAHINAAVEICMKAYDTNDVSVRTVTGDDDNLLDPFFRSSIHAGAFAGKLYFATDGFNRTVGVALWFPPGQDIFSSDKQRELGFNDFFSKLSIDSKNWWKDTYKPQFLRLTDTALGPMGKLNSWYLQLIAVDPVHQRRGVATALIKSVRAQARGSVLSVTATVESNAVIYEKLGFIVNGRMIMSGPLGEFPVVVLSLHCC